jgi:TolB-like protein
MSPEQARSEDLDARSDIFSFGVVLYEMATGKKPFTGTNVVTTLHAVISQKAPSPLTLNPGLPVELEGIIGKAMEKDRAKRYQNAAEMKADLERLKKETESGLTRSRSRIVPPKVAAHVFQKTSSKQTWILVGLVGLLLAILAAVGAWWFRQRGVNAHASNRTIAVLPLQNINNNQEGEFLRLALADEIANTLTYARTLEIRPSSATRKYANGQADPQTIGQELQVGTVVTGHFLEENKKVLVTLEAIAVKDNKLIWTGSFTAPSDNLVALQNQLSKKVRQELLPALGVARTSLEASSTPQNTEGYDWYLRSLPVLHDPQPNKEAIAMLERSLKLDPNYAPAWEALGRRYYFDAIYSGGGAAQYDRSNDAYRKALALEPGRVRAAGFLATNEVEVGHLEKAYQDARDLVARRPDNAFAHYSLAYVLRYAGMLDEAQRECDAGVAIDPGDFNWRSCAFAFFEVGKTAFAKQYLSKDAGSEWSNAVMVSVLMREGRMKEAREATEKMSTNPTWMRDFLQSCLNKQPREALDLLAEQARDRLLPEQDSELKYYQGALLAQCGEKKIAYEFLRKAVDQRYCAYQALQSDPLLTGVQGDSDFKEIVQAAGECQAKFKAGSGAK